MFFTIPAHGHTNPTLPLVRELVSRGHRVRYYSFPEFREKVESAGAEFVDCAPYLPPQPKDLKERAGKDFALLIEMVADTTVNMDTWMAGEVEEFRPDCVISDSVCFWGKLFAWKYNIPFVCSTTTMAFNRYTAGMIRGGLGELVRMFTGMPRINKKMAMLREHGYPVKDFVSIVQNDNDTNTIVYTSRMFQPKVETFSEKCAFIGPSLVGRQYPEENKERPRVYISLGTVLNDNIAFYRTCARALGDMDCDVVISAGKDTDLSRLSDLPANVQVFPYVDQPRVLSGTDVFLTHCGMNSVSESLYMGVPMVLFPQHGEQNAVAARVEQLEAGLRLKNDTPKSIQKAVWAALDDPKYRENAQKIKADFRSCGGAPMGAELIETVIKNRE